MMRLIGKRKYFYILSTALIVPGLVFIALGGIRLGIDFTGGSISEYELPEGINQSVVADTYLRIGITDVTINQLEGNTIRVTSEEIRQEEHTQILTELATEEPGIQELSFASIGPTIGQELKSKALTATILVVVFIMLYITWAFRKSTTSTIKSWVFGSTAFVALVHDLLIVVGVFAALGYFLGTRIDSLFVTSLLTVLGFSVHDTIVVFDRVRERLKLQSSQETFEDVVESSVNQTLVRSLATSFTTVLVLVSLLFFGGETIRTFVVALLVGMIAGTYSSICIASPLLVTWYKYKSER